MEVVATAVALGVVAGVLGDGRLRTLAATPLRWPGLAVAALGAQVMLGLVGPDLDWPSSATFGVLVGSYGLLLAFVALNLRLTGMSVVLVGVALNALAVAVNGGMPVRLPADAGETRTDALAESVTHLPEDEADALAVLGQTVPVPEPVDRAVSFGDLIAGAGIVDVLFRASRTKPGRTPARVTPPVRAVAVAVAGEGSDAGGRDAPGGDDAGEGERDVAVAASGP